jgi:hypothetical protein
MTSRCMPSTQSSSKLIGVYIAMFVVNPLRYGFQNREKSFVRTHVLIWGIGVISKPSILSDVLSSSPSNACCVHRCHSRALCRNGGIIPELRVFFYRLVSGWHFPFVFKIITGVHIACAGDYHWSFTALWYAFMLFSICAVAAIVIKVAMRDNKVLLLKTRYILIECITTSRSCKL